MMLSYAGSRLAASSEEDSRSIRFALGALRKNVCTKSNERLLIEVEIFVPKNIADLVSKSDKRRLVAEIVLKLVKQLKAGPLKRFDNNRDWINGAIAFLATDVGDRWVHSWFLPKDTELTPHNHPQAPDAHFKQTHNVTLSYSLFPQSDSSRNSSLKPTHKATLVGPPSSPPPLADRSAEIIMTLKPRVNQHRKVPIDPLSLSLCNNTVRCISQGRPLPTVSPLAVTPTLGDMECGGIAMNKKYAAQIIQRYVNPTIMLVTFLLTYFLARFIGNPIY